MSAHEPPMRADRGSSWHWLLVVIAAIACAFASAPTQAQAPSYTLGLHLATAHFGPGDLQAYTPGVYGRIDTGPLAGLTAGTYRNSYDNRSTYLGWTAQTKDATLAITLGAVTGYSAARVMPVLVPSARIALMPWAALRVSYIPKPIKEGHTSSLHLSLEHSFNGGNP